LTSRPRRKILLRQKTALSLNQKENSMYKTIVLRFLRDQRPEVQNLLKRQQMLLPTLDRLATQLKTSHEAYKENLSRSSPGRNMDQIASEALELAIEDMDYALQTEFPPEGTEDEPLSLDAAMAFIRRHTPPA